MMLDLNTIWFLLVGVLIVGYAILDGFDLGAGVISLFLRDPREKRLCMKAIAPVWDGNEVWLLTAGGALFAAFPPVYAAVFSGFYIAFVLLLVALIFRAVSLEFYGKVDSVRWHYAWGWAFGLGSLVAAILFGVAFGNILRGLPIDSKGEFTGTFLGLLNPYALSVGVLGLAMFIMHGGAYLALKTDGELRERMHSWAMGGWAALAVLYIPVTFFTLTTSPFLFEKLSRNMLFYLALIPLLVSIPCVPAALTGRRYGRAFVASAATIASMIAMAGISLYPMLVPSRLYPSFSLTIYNASSTPLTLKVMFIIAAVGVPVMLVYTAYVYRVFRGTVRHSDEGY